MEVEHGRLDDDFPLEQGGFHFHFRPSLDREALAD